MSEPAEISFIAELEDVIKSNRELIALTDYKGDDVSYGELSALIEELKIEWNGSGLVPGDRIAILAANSAKWLEVYFAAILNGYVAVLIPINLAQSVVLDIIIDSECKILYTSGEYASIVCQSNLRVDVRDIGTCSAFSLNKQRNVGRLGKPNYSNSIDENATCTILYTSGSLGVPKGSMITYKNISYQVRIVSNWMRMYQGGRSQVNFLPFTHIYGLICDALTPICMGMHLVVLGSYTSAGHLLDALKIYRPNIFLAIPLVVDGMVNIIENNRGDDILLDSAASILNLRKIVSLSFGGNLRAILTGGSPMSAELEKKLLNTLQLPFVTGYGTTECGILSAGIVGKYQRGSCGRILDNNVIRIAGGGVSSIVGEVQIKGDNVFAGYYKDIKATKAAFTEDGWFKTGDLGYIDDEGNLFITGRCKDMLLTSNGENIYPEEVESIVNASPYVKESILVQRDEKLYAIVVPDREKAEAEGLDAEGLDKGIDETVREASKKLPGFTIISGFELRDEPLERTPKGSLKRYLYSDGIKEN